MLAENNSQEQLQENQNQEDNAYPEINPTTTGKEVGDEMAEANANLEHMSDNSLLTDKSAELVEETPVAAEDAAPEAVPAEEKPRAAKKAKAEPIAEDTTTPGVEADYMEEQYLETEASSEGGQAQPLEVEETSLAAEVSEEESAPVVKSSEVEASAEKTAPVAKATEETAAVAEEVPHEEEHHDDAHEGDIDYHALSRKELADKLDEIIEKKTVVRGDSLRKIREAFEAGLEVDRSNALAVYLSNGGNPEDFKFQDDAVTKRYKESQKKAFELRKQILDEQNKTRQINLKLKQQVIEQLKHLLEEEESEKSLQEVRRIQEQWRSIGPVPLDELAEIQNNYQFLIEKFYNRRSMFIELKELDRRKNSEHKKQLLERAGKLADEPRVVKALQDFNRLFDEWKSVGPATTKEENDQLWSDFRAIQTNLVEKKKKIDDGLKKEAEELEGKRKELVAKAEELTGFTSERIQDWQAKTEELVVLQNAWKETGNQFRDRHASLSKAFWGFVKKFYSTKEAFFKRLDRERSGNLEVKNTILKEVQSLTEMEDKDAAQTRFNELLDQWKKSGPVGNRFKDKLNKQFSAAIEAFFESKKSKFKHRDDEQKQNLEKKQALIAQLGEMAAAGTGSEEALLQIQKDFDAAGFVPFKEKDKVQEDYKAAMAKAVEASGEVVDKNTLKLKLLKGGRGFRGGDRGERGDRGDRGGNRGDRGGDFRRGGGGHGGHSGGQDSGLDGRIRRLQADVSTYRNNLEFFASSKTADKIRKEYEQKIGKAEEEIQILKDQLKQLKESRNA